jgi:protein phosphatase
MVYRDIVASRAARRRKISIGARGAMAEANLMVGSATDVGQRRDHNEDAFVTFETEDGATVLVVADGMGGHLAGEVASAMAIETLQRDLTRLDGDPGDALRTVIERANLEIWQESERDSEKAGMGSTIVVAIVRDGQAYLANAGDSPAYLIRDGQTEQITRDHGLVAEQVEAGIIREEDAENHPYRHILTRCLGVEEHVEVEVYPPLALQPGDVLVLCSDGLTEHVKRREVAALAVGADSTEVAQSLVDVANQRGGHDNITVVVARVDGAGAEASEPPFIPFVDDEAETTQMEILPPTAEPPAEE